MDEPKYDIAISFLHEDQKLAEELVNRLQEYFRVFAYFREQDEIAGTDGINTFVKTFRDDASLVVI